MCAFSKIFLQQTVTTTTRHTKMTQATTFSFEAKVVSRGYHVYQNTTWLKGKEGDEEQ